MTVHRHFHVYVRILLLFFVVGGLSCKKDKQESLRITPFDFLSNQNYDHLDIEVIYVDGFQPTQGALDNLKNFLSARLNKAGGVTIIQNNMSSPGKSILTLDDVRKIELDKRTRSTHDRTLTASILFLDGDYTENQANSKVLGIAYGSSSMVIFEKTIHDLSGSIGQPSTLSLESTVCMHEFGHILGLTNNGTAMQTPHEDQANKGHCNNNKCLMYYLVESSDFMSQLMGSGVPSLDANCLADLKANGGK